METARQLSVQLVNRPGHFSAVLTALNKEKVALRAFSVMDSGKRSTLRFVPDDSAAARNALDSLNAKYDECEVLLAAVSNQSGGLPKTCQRLADEHLNIDYAYGALSSPLGAKGGNMAVIKVNDLVKAQRVLGEPPAGANSRPKKKPGRRPVHAR